MTELGLVVMTIGALLGVIGGIGVARLETTLARTHAASKPASLGMVLVALGAGIAARSWVLVGVAVVMGVFQFATAPVAGHLVGRATSHLSTREEDPVPGRPARPWTLALQTTVLWAVLWRDPSPGVLIAGAAIGIVLGLIFGSNRPAPRLRARAIRIMAAYLVSLVQSNVRTAIQVIRMSPEDTSEAVAWCDLETQSVAGAVFIANAMTFSPGTLTLEMSDSSPYAIAVHALGKTEREITAEVTRLDLATRQMYRVI